MHVSGITDLATATDGIAAVCNTHVVQYDLLEDRKDKKLTCSHA